MACAWLALALLLCGTPLRADAPAPAPGDPSSPIPQAVFQQVFGNNKAAWEKYRTNKDGLTPQQMSELNAQIGKFASGGGDESQRAQLASDMLTGGPRAAVTRIDQASQSQTQGQQRDQQQHQQVGDAVHKATDAASKTKLDQQHTDQTPDGKEKPSKQAAASGVAGAPQPSLAMSAPPAPSSPDGPSKITKGQNPAFLKYLTKGLLGGLAGAAVGIGLLPLLGPIGILFGALIGAAITITAASFGS